jgi:hypothetical protein
MTVLEKNIVESITETAKIYSVKAKNIELTVEVDSSFKSGANIDDLPELDAGMSVATLSNTDNTMQVTFQVNGRGEDFWLEMVGYAKGQSGILQEVTCDHESHYELPGSIEKLITMMTEFYFDNVVE